MERLVRKMREAGASDLHLTTGAPPAMRVDGHILVMPGEPILSAEALAAAVHAVAPTPSQKEFASRSDADFAWELPGVARFRFNLFVDRRGPAAVIRAIPFELRSPGDLGLPGDVLELCKLKKGLVLVTGATGSGKSTTLAALINHINDTRPDHIITLEDPIEFVHDSKKCLVHQREIGRHTRSFKDALRAALREDPDVILVGELRDLETMALAVETAETGHLVFGTLHTSTAPSTVDRVIDIFPADRQDQIRQMLSESLRGVITQTLCKKMGGPGRVAAYEILFNTGAVANLIRERKTFQIPSVMQTGRGAGMVTMNDSLIDLVRKKLVDPREALSRAHNKAELKGLLQREGHPVEAAA
jgi:twitching motility protein PilT